MSRGWAGLQGVLKDRWGSGRLLWSATEGPHSSWEAPGCHPSPPSGSHQWLPLAPPTQPEGPGSRPPGPPPLPQSRGSSVQPYGEPQRPTTVSAALRVARLAPAARTPPRPPSQGRDHRAQTRGAAAPGCARSSASCRARRALIGGAARPPSGVAQSEPRTLARLPEGRGRGGRWLQRGTSPCGGTGFVTPPSLPGVPRNPSRPRPAPLSGAWRVRVLPYALSPSHLGLAGARAHPRPRGRV